MADSVAALSLRVRLERAANSAPGFLLDVEFSVPSGFTILFGPSGAGKSTLLDCIAGLVTPNQGRITSGEELLFDSANGANLPPQKRRVGYLFQSPALFPHLTVQQNVEYGLSHLAVSERYHLVKETLAAFRVAALSKRLPAEISGGEAQRVALARALVTLPRVLLLDEPLAGLDAALKNSILADLREWNATHCIPILYVTHDRAEVDALGERAIVIDHGEIVSQGTPREVLDAPRKESIALASGFENLLHGTVEQLSKEDGIMRVRLGGSQSEIDVPIGYAGPGDSVRVAIRAGDILLATEKVSGISAQNILQGTVQSIERRGTTLVCRVLAGVSFEVHITLGAQRSLRLEPGKTIWLVLKAHSCQVVV